MSRSFVVFAVAVLQFGHLIEARAQRVVDEQTVLKHTLSRLGHFGFGDITPLQDDPRCVMHWRDSDLAVCHVCSGAMVTEPERLRVRGYAVVYADAARLVSQFHDEQAVAGIAVYDLASGVEIDSAALCRHFCSWLDDKTWLGIHDDPYERVGLSLVVRNTETHEETRWAVAEWERYSDNIPLFVDADHSVVAVELGRNAGHPFFNEVREKLCVFQFDRTSGDVDWSHQVDPLPGYCLSVSEIASTATQDPDVRLRYVATTEGLFKLTYGSHGVAMEDLLRMPIEKAVFDPTRTALWYSWRGAISRLEWSDESVCIVATPPLDHAVDEIIVLSNGVVVASCGIAHSVLSMRRLRSPGWITHETYGRPDSLRFSPSADRCILSGDDSVIYAITEHGLLEELRVPGLINGYLFDPSIVCGLHRQSAGVAQNGYGLVQISHEGATSRLFAHPFDPIAADSYYPSPRAFFGFPEVSPDLEHVLDLDSGVLVNFDGPHKFSIPENYQLCVDVMAGGVFLLKDVFWEGAAPYCVVDANDYSLREIQPVLENQQFLGSAVLLDRDRLMGIVFNEDKERLAELVVVDRSGQATRIGETTWNLVTRHVDLYANLHATPEREFVGFFTTEGFVRMDTRTFESETYVIPGLSDPDLLSFNNTGDAIAWVENATLYFTRLDSD